MIPRRISIALLVGVHAGSCAAIAQPTAPPPTEHSASVQPEPELMQAVRDRLNAPYLTDEERADLAVEHGVWNDETLLDPARRARAALITGAYDHPVFMDDGASPLDRAQAALMRGQPDQTLTLLEEPTPDTPLARLALRARAHAMLGDTGAGIGELEALEALLAETVVDDATELGFGVRGLMHLYTLRAIDGDASVVYRQLSTLIARGRDEIDQLNTEIRMVEAELLYEHHNRKDARDAALEVIKRNPNHARAAALLGNIAVDGFLFDDAERIADRIDSIASPGNDNPPPTVHGALIRARIGLRRRDPLSAEQAIDPVLARMPDQRNLLAMEAAAAAGGFRESSTERLLDGYNTRSPGQPEALVVVARTLAEARQYEQAEQMFLRAIERAPYWGEPRLQLGLMRVQSGDDAGAKSSLESAIALDPFNLRAQNSLKLVRELMGYEEIETEHFIIRYKSGIDGILAREMVPELERMHARVTGDAPGGGDHEPTIKTRIELMPDHEWFAVRIGGMPSIHTMAASTGPIIAMESPRDGAKSSVGAYDWARVLQHEYTHTVNLSRTKNRIIHWMTEANAVYNEDAPRDFRQWKMLLDAFNEDRLFDLQEINEAFVRPKKPGDRGLAYAQGAWMYEFIIERFGPDTPLAIMDASAAGRSATEAFTETLGMDLPSFRDEFLLWAQEQLHAFGLLLQEDAEPIESLLVNDAGERVRPSPGVIDKLLEEHPDHPQLMYLKVAVMLRNEQSRLTPQELSMIQRYARANPTEESPHRVLVKHFLDAETFEEQRGAIEHLEYLDAREIHSSAYADQLAMLYAKAGMGERAIEKSLGAVRRAPFSPHAREQAARIALIAGDKELAAYQLGVLNELEPDREIHQQRLDALRERTD